MKINTILKIALPIILLLAMSISGVAQDFMTYQGVVLNDDASPISEESVTVTICINEPDFIYTTVATTSSLGAFSIQIPIEDIDFTQDIDYVLKSSITTSAGTVTSETMMATVPKAMVADQAKSIIGITEIDQSPTNEIQTLSIQGDQLTISNGNTINLPTSGGGGDGDNDPNNEVQTLSYDQVGSQITLGLSLTGEVIQIDVADADADNSNEVQTLFIENGSLTLSGATGNPSSIPLANLGDGTTDADSDPENEIQTLSKSGNTVTLSNTGGSFTDEVDDNDSDPGNEIQELTVNGNMLSISDGNSVLIPNQDADSDPENEIQTLSKSGNTVTLSNTGGSFTDEVDDNDSDPGNEIQELTVNGNMLSISDGNSVLIPNQDADSDPENEIQTLSKSGNTVTLSNTGGSFTDEVDDNDSDPSNELQELTWTGSALKISGGNEISLPDDDNLNELQNLFLSGTELGLSMSASQIDMSPFLSPWEFPDPTMSNISFLGGKVSIGNTNPVYDLDVTGSGRFSGQVVVEGSLSIDQDLAVVGNLGVNDALIFGNLTVFDDMALNGNHKFIMQGDYNIYSDGNNLRFDGDITPHNVAWDIGNNNSTDHWDNVIAEDIILFSDRRLKKGIQSLPSVLNKLMDLRPVTYQYIESHSRDQKIRNGLIAQDLLEVFPEVVMTEDIDVDIKTGETIVKPVEFLGVNYIELIPVTIKSIQEQQDLIQQQQAEIDMLKGELKTIKLLLLELKEK